LANAENQVQGQGGRKIPVHQDTSDLHSETGEASSCAAFCRSHVLASSSSPEAAELRGEAAFPQPHTEPEVPDLSSGVLERPILHGGCAPGI